MKREKVSFIYLTGGLGNQLFQIAFLLTRDSKIKIVETTLGRPRRSNDDLPDVFSFAFPGVLEKLELETDFPLTRKSINYLLRDGLEPFELNKIPGMRNLTRVCADILISRALKSRVKVNVSSDNGFVHMPISSKNEFLIGYFQSFRWMYEDKEVHDLMKNLKLNEQRDELRQFVAEKKNRTCIAMHVRLGDYLLDPSIGVLSEKYYEEALARISKSIKIDEIWLFSNDPNRARNYLPGKYKDLVVVVNDANWNAAETLEAMRHAKAYIIGNSSLSWWGAAMSYTESALVIAPTPWFKSRKDPKNLLPTEWIQINGWGETRQ